MRQLPPGWAAAKLADITEYLSRGKQPKYVEHSNLPVINQRAIQWSGIQNKYLKYVDPAQSDRWEPERFIQLGDILWNSTGRGTVGRACLVTQEDLEPPKVVDSHVTILRPNREAINPSFLFAWVQSAEAQDLVESLATGATNQIELGRKAIASMYIPIAPISEQGQITEKLDSLFSRIDKCRERLARIESILKCFRQSVLALSTSGKLTLDWRKNRTHGEEGDIEEGILPVGWEWKLMSEVGSIQLGRQRAPRYHSGQYMRPYLRVQNIFEDKIDLSDVMEMDFPPQDFEKYQLVYGDILLNEGQSPEFLGRPAIYRNELPGACFTNTLIRFQAFDFVNRDFALLVFRHYMHSGRFMREGKITTNIAHLSAGRFSKIEFPLPPLEEQQEIVNRSNRLFAFADNIESKHQNALTKLEGMKSSILFRAFRGELVSQQNASESASILIEKARLAKIENKKEKNTKTKRKPTMSKLSKKAVREVILALPEQVFEFEDLRGEVSGDYDLLRDILFDLLNEQDAIINQFFDREMKSMKFSRRSQ